jgi:hypothetical protein
MTAGHFGLAAAVKAQERPLPLWALMLATYLLDVFFIPLYLAGIETFELIPGAPAYGGAIIHADYTHSLVGAAAISAVAGLLAAWRWGRRGGIVIGAVVFSHWVLDLVVHRADLPILPGNAGTLPTLGFGLWQFPIISAALEAILIVVGAWLYFGAALSRPPQYRSRALVAATVTAVLLLATFLSDVLPGLAG